RMTKLAWVDNRLGEFHSGGYAKIFRVDPKTSSFKYLVQATGQLLHGSKELIDLDILCHADMATVDGVIHGGMGLQLCLDGIRVNTAFNFQLLRGMLRLVTIRACAAAEICPTRAGLGGDGNLLCSR